MKETADEAVAPRQRRARRRLPAAGRDIPWSAARDVWWHEVTAAQADACPALEVEGDHPCLIYTSGTPETKGAVSRTVDFS